MSRELNGYRQLLALCALHRVGADGGSAGDVCELMGSLAQAEGHPRDCWRGINSQSVAGHLRSLEQQGKASRTEPRGNARAGRLEPIYVATGPLQPRMPLPHPPGPDQVAEDAPETPAPTAASKDQAAIDDAYNSLSRPQILAVLRVSDMVTASVTRFMRDLEDVRERARRELAKVGITEDGPG